MQRQSSRRWIVALPLTLALGCASHVPPVDWSAYTGPGQEHFRKEEIRLPLPDDPWEPVNRFIWGVNDVIVLGVVAPAATVWRFLVPEDVRGSLVTAIDNVGYPVRWVNNMLQGRVDRAGDETDRFLINSTLGMLGLVDVASELGIGPAREDLGRTLAMSGWTDPPFLTLPLVGPSSTRDALCYLGDAALHPASYFFPAFPIMSFIEGAEHIDDYERIVRTNLDPYATGKLVWTAVRRVVSEAAFETPLEEGSADELRAMSYAYQDPWFPSRRQSRRVRIAATGRTLPYELWMQPDPGPIVFILPGVGTHRLSATSLAVAEMLVERGFSAVTLSSAMHADFIETASTAVLPGYVPADARDVHAALDAVDADITRRYGDRVRKRVLLGMSLGGLHTLYIAAAAGDSNRRATTFDRYIAINPPVDLSHGVRQLDALYNAPLNVPAERRDEFMLAAIQKAIQLETAQDRPRRAEIAFGRTELAFLIGLNFRLALHDAIWASQSRHNLGVLRRPLNPWRRGPASEEILDISFTEYFHAFVLPHYAGRDHDITTGEQFFAMMDVRSLDGPFPVQGTVRVFANRDDFLLTPEHIDWLVRTFGEPYVTCHDRGGHMGSLFDPVAREGIVESIADLLER